MKNIFMQQRKGYIQKGFENKVCRLLHTLYGFKQSLGYGMNEWIIFY
jgi:hypothetical protein